MSTSFAEGEKMCLSQKMPKKNSTKESKGMPLNKFKFFFYRRSKIFIEINDE